MPPKEAVRQNKESITESTEGSGLLDHSVPRHWDSTRLKWLSEIEYGFSQPPPRDPNGIPFLRATDIAAGKIDLSEVQRVNPNEIDESAGVVLEPGDILVVRSGAYTADSAIVPDELAGALAGYDMVVQPKRIDAKYLSWSLLSSYVLEGQLKEKTSRTAQPHLNSKELGKSRILVPPLSEQKAISAFVDERTQRIDRLIARKRRLINLLEEKHTALVTRAVTKGLNPDVPMKDSGVEWLGEVPKHWETAKIRWVAEMQSGHTPTRSNDQYWSKRDGYPWVSLNDSMRVREQDYISETEYRISKAGLENSSARILPERAVVFSRDATVGLCAITDRPMAVSQHFVAWLCGDEIVPEFLLQVMKALRPELEKLTAGATISTIGMPDIASLVTPLPPVEEQKRIVSRLNEKRRGLQDIEHLSEKMIDLLSEYRSALITAAVTGKIDVRDHAA